MTRRGWREGNALAAVAAVLVLAGVANYLGGKYHTQWDWTKSGVYTLSQRSRRILEQLDRPVRFVSFLIPEQQVNPDAVEQIHVLLDAYRAANPRMVSVERIDPTRDPARARALLSEFGLDPLTDPIDIVMVASGDRSKQVRLDQMVRLDDTAFGGPGAVRSLTAESALTGAVLAVTRERKPVVRFATGHGERPARGSGEGAFGHLVAALEREDFEVSDWNALGSEAVPSGTDLVIVAAPTKPWLAAERDALARFLDAGGAAWLLLDPVFQRAGGGALVDTGLGPLLSAWGIEPRDDIVIDPSHALPFFGAETFYAAVDPGHPISENLAGQTVLLTLARSFAVADPSPEGLTLTTLVSSSSDSWSEQDLGALEAGVERGEDEPRGPLPVVVAAERTPTADESPPGADESEAGAGAGKSDDDSEGSEGRKPRGGRLVVTGDADFAANGALDQLSNRALALDIASWLAEGERNLGIPPKDRTLSQLFLTSGQLYGELLPLLVIILPLGGIAAGLAIWQRRKRG